MVNKYFWDHRRSSGVVQICSATNNGICRWRQIFD